jgi:hypothetical protein
MAIAPMDATAEVSLLQRRCKRRPGDQVVVCRKPIRQAGESRVLRYASSDLLALLREQAAL